MPPAASTKQNHAYTMLKRLVGKATCKPGDQLPPLRQLAKQFDSNLNAIYIAIRRLEHEGLVQTQHGRGVFITTPQPRMRSVLLLTRIQGHLWSQISQHFVQQFTASPQNRLIIEYVPDEKSGQLPAFRDKLKTLIESGIDTVIFNGMLESNIQHVFDDLPDKIQKLCILSRNAIPNQNVGGVTSDWYHGGYIAIRHLIESGAKHIVHILPNEHGQGQEISRGTEAAIAEHANQHAKEHSQLIKLSRVTVPNFAGNAMTNTQKLLKDFPLTDGVLTYGDFVAVPLIRSLQSLGKKVPDDILVTGYYDTPWVELSSPTLTSVNLCSEQIIDQVIQMYLAGDFHTQHSVHPKLIARESTRRG